MKRHYGRQILAKSILGLMCIPLVFGCTKTDKDLQLLTRQQAETIQSLNTEIDRLNQDLEDALTARQDLFSAKTKLEQQLASELAKGDISLQMDRRGLVVTVLDRVLFDSGKADIKTSAESALDKVAEAFQGDLADNRVYVEGHTDNVPIRYSGWKSNWELSTARATEVIHYFDSVGIAPERFAACGYAKYRPVESNDTAEGRQKNRRVEIIISPEKVTE